MIGTVTSVLTLIVVASTLIVAFVAAVAAIVGAVAAIRGARYAKIGVRRQLRAHLSIHVETIRMAFTDARDFVLHITNEGPEDALDVQIWQQNKPLTELHDPNVDNPGYLGNIGPGRSVRARIASRSLPTITLPLVVRWQDNNGNTGTKTVCLGNDR